MWQDYLFGIGQAVFALSLLPSILGKDKPSVWTSSITALMLFLFAFAYATLSMPSAMAATTICGIGWAVLAFQKLWE